MVLTTFLFRLTGSEMLQEIKLWQTTLGSTVSSTPDSVSPTASLVGVLPTATTGIAATVIVDFDDETAFNPASVTIGSLSAVDGANVATIAVASTTTIGNNGVRVNFDVTAPADGSYTVTVPVNSYSDAAGNQGSLVNLGTMTASGPTGTNFFWANCHFST